MINNISNFKIVNRQGYNCVYLPNHPKAYGDGMVYEHVLVAENIIGRYLHQDEVVHHINGNKKDNNKANLMVFATNYDHALYHSCIANQINFALICKNKIYHCIKTYDENSTERQKYLRLRRCPICGELKSVGAYHCFACSKILKNENRPSRNVLKNQLKLRNFRQIASNFKVTDNAVRKWCKFYHLPYKTSELKTLTDYQIEKL